MLKMGFKDGFVFLMRWGMIFLIQFNAKMEEKDGFWSEIKREENAF